MKCEPLKWTKWNAVLLPLPSNVIQQQSKMSNIAHDSIATGIDALSLVLTLPPIHIWRWCCFHTQVRIDAFGPAYFRQQTHTRTHWLANTLSMYSSIWNTRSVCEPCVFAENDFMNEMTSFASLGKSGLVYARILQMKNLQMKIHTGIQGRARARTNTHTYIYTRGVRKSCLNAKLSERIHAHNVCGCCLSLVLLLLLPLLLLWKICRIYVSPNGNVLNVLEVTSTLCGITQQTEKNQ